jgi:hypothetical protein
VAGPDFLTVEEAARVLRIGRTAAYLAAKRYRDTDGAEGLPVVAVRGSLRVPRRRLEAMAGGPIDIENPLQPATSADRHDQTADATTPATTARRTPKPRKPTADDQSSLPFTA